MSDNKSNANTLRLVNAYNMLIETEEVGNGTLIELNRQREVLTKTKNNLIEVNSSIKTSDNFLNKMDNRQNWCCVVS
jgi:hypothetical protein